MRNLTKSILIILLFSHLLIGCSVFRKGDCGCDEKTCAAPGQPGHGRWEIMVEPGVTLEDKLKMIEEQKRQEDEKRKKQLRELAESEKKLREADKEIQKLLQAKKDQEDREHDLKFKGGKIFRPNLSDSNVKSVKRCVEFIRKKIDGLNDTTPLDDESKQRISKLFIFIKETLQEIQEGMGGIEKCLNMTEKSPRINYEQEAKNLLLAKQLVKDLEGYKAELCTLLASRRKELNHPELEAAYREKATLHEAALAGDLDLVQKIVARGVPIQLATSTNQTALHYVALASQPNIAVADWLLQRGIPVDAMDDQGNTALSLAVERGHLDLIRLLRKSGTLFNFKHPKSWSLLHLAAYHGQLAIVKYLVEEEKISPLTFDPAGNTALILALGNKHEAVVSYLRGKTDLPTFYIVLKEEIKKRFGGRLLTHIKGICEYTGLNPAYVNIDSLIDGWVEGVQVIVEKEEAAYATLSKHLQVGDSAIQPQINETLKDLLNELKRYFPNLPESSQKALDKLSVESLQPLTTGLAKHLDEAKEEIARFSQEQAQQTQERIEKMRADMGKLKQHLQQLAKQTAAKEEARRREQAERQRRYELATRNIAVPSMKYYFIPSFRSSNVEEIRRYMKFIRENIALNPINTPLNVKQQQNLQSLLKQVSQEERELAISYRDLKNYVNHRSGDQFFLEQAKKKRMLMELIREAMIQNRIDTLTKEQVKDLPVLLEEIYEDGKELYNKDGEELIKSYEDIKNYVEHRGGYEEFLKRAKQKGICEEEAIKVEAAFINRKLENTQLAEQLLKELQSIKKEAYEILKNNKEDVCKYIVANQHEAHFENDYSIQELTGYINDYGLEEPRTKEQIYVFFFKDELIKAVEKELIGKVLIDRSVLERIFKKAYQLAEKAQPDLELTVQFFGELKKYWVLELQNTLLKLSNKTKMNIEVYSEIFNDVYRQTAQVWNEETQKEQAFIATLRGMFQHSAVAVLKTIGTQEPIDKSYILSILQNIPLKEQIEKYYPVHQVISYRDRHSYVTGLVLHSLLTAAPVSLQQTIQHKKLNEVKKQVHQVYTVVSTYLK